MKNEMKLIMENWRRKILKEDIPGEEKWEKGFDSDFGGKYNPQTGGMKIEGFSLVIFDPSDLKIPYPQLSGKNHGLASHAIKHAAEFFPLDKLVKKFKKMVVLRYGQGKDVYLRTTDKSKNITTYKINKNITDAVAKYKKGQTDFFVKNGWDSNKMSDKSYRDEWNSRLKPQLQKKYNEENADLVKEILSVFIDNKPNEISPEIIQETSKIIKNTLQKIKTLQVKDFLVFLDFHYDANNLDIINAYVPHLAGLYDSLVQKFETGKYGTGGESKKDPNQPEKTVTTRPWKGGTVVVIRKKGKISSAMKVKGNVKPEKYFTK